MQGCQASAPHVTLQAVIKSINVQHVNYCTERVCVSLLHAVKVSLLYQPWYSAFSTTPCKFTAPVIAVAQYLFPQYALDFPGVPFYDAIKKG